MQAILFINSNFFAVRAYFLKLFQHLSFEQETTKHSTHTHPRLALPVAIYLLNKKQLNIPHTHTPPRLALPVAIYLLSKKQLNIPHTHPLG